METKVNGRSVLWKFTQGADITSKLDSGVRELTSEATKIEVIPYINKLVSISNSKIDLRYLDINEGHVVSVRLPDGNYWIVSESQDSKVPIITEDSINEIIERLDNLGEKLDSISKALVWSQDTDNRYAIDTDAVTCECRGFTYKYSRHVIGTEERNCKHLSLYYKMYPELLPKELRKLDYDLGSQTISVSKSDGKVRYPRDLFDCYVHDIKECMNDFNIFDKVEVCGSYRRRCEMVSDLDILCTLKDENSSWDSFLTYLEDTMGYQLIKEIGRGEKKVAYLIDNMIHVDFKLVPDSSWIYSVMHFTGSKVENIELRRAAIRKGCTLNEYGLFYEYDGSQVQNIKSDKDVYKFLDIPYKDPWDR